MSRVEITGIVPMHRVISAVFALGYRVTVATGLYRKHLQATHRFIRGNTSVTAAWPISHR